MGKIYNCGQCTHKGVLCFINYVTEKCNIAGREKFGEFPQNQTNYQANKFSVPKTVFILESIENNNNKKAV